jgi:DNA-directed RNA polymerase I subunit RPA1
MTLNTFHFAGQFCYKIVNVLNVHISDVGHGAANVTLGIPRLREIVMTASQKPKTPSMTMEVALGVSQLDVDIFCKRASKLTLSQLVDNVTVKERLTAQSDARWTEFVIDIVFFPAEEYTEEYDILPEEVLAVFAAKFPLILKKEIQTEMKKLDADLRGQIAQLGKGKASKEPVVGEVEAEDGEGDGEGARRGKDDDDQSEQGDGDAVDAKRARQRKEQTSYESDNDSERDDLDDAAIEAIYASDTEDGEGEDDNDNDKIGRPTAIHAQTQIVADAFMNAFHQATSFTFTKSKCSIRLEVRVICVLHFCRHLIRFQFPADFPKILLVGIVERTCLKTVIREIPGITECFSALIKERGAEKIRVRYCLVQPELGAENYKSS